MSTQIIDLSAKKSTLEQKQTELQTQVDLLKGQESTVQRELDVISIVENGYVEIISDTVAYVKGSEEVSYKVEGADAKTCECKDHKYRAELGIICKHRMGVIITREAQKVTAAEPQTPMQIAMAALKDNPDMTQSDVMLHLMKNGIDMSDAYKLVMKLRCKE